MIPKTNALYLVAVFVVMTSCYTYNVRKYTLCNPCTTSSLQKKNGIYLHDAGYDSTEKMHKYKSFMLYSDCTVLGGGNKVIYATPSNVRKKVSEYYMDADSAVKSIWGCYSIADDAINLQTPIPIAAGLFGGEWDVLRETGKVLSDTSILINEACVKRPRPGGGCGERNELYVFFETSTKPDSTNWLRKRKDNKK